MTQLPKAGNVAHTKHWNSLLIEPVEEAGLIANRNFGHVYKVSPRRADLHAFLIKAVESSGGRILYVSEADRVPISGIQLDSDERLGLLVYPFRMTRNATRNRPADEVRGQLRYGGGTDWNQTHPVGRDVAGVDVTVIVGIDVDNEILLGLDARLWDPLPMGISFYAKVADLDRAKRSSWLVWEKVNRSGPKRYEPARSPTELETMVAFTPDRFIDYARLERRATSLRLDPSLRFAAATAMAERASPELQREHVLEKQFALTSEQILDIIGGRNRLAVAVRGGVAEHHLEYQLRLRTDIAQVERLDIDAMHDFNVILVSGKILRVECKNASPHVYPNGDYKVEVQKTRASKGDPASRFYEMEAFDVVAACLFTATGQWSFRFGLTHSMQRHRDFPGRLAPIQRISSTWVGDLAQLGY